MRLFTYKQTHDTGFAPNPFHGVCTLATCKPKIRLHKKIGDWIAGFTSARLNGDEVGHERLIYLMRVTDKMPLELYFTAKSFAAKHSTHPDDRSTPCISSVGDNIYERRDGHWVLHTNRSHKESAIKTDTDGKFVLISTEFWYFGSTPLIVPDEVRPRIPKGQAGHGIRTLDVTRAQAFVDFVREHEPGVHACPTQWKRDDTTWKQRRSSCG